VDRLCYYLRYAQGDGIMICMQSLAAKAWALYRQTDIHATYCSQPASRVGTGTETAEQEKLGVSRDRLEGDAYQW